MSAPGVIPILLCGKIPSHIQAVSEIVKPEFEVVQICTSPEEAHSVIASMLSPPSASSKPKVIVMGGGYSAANFEAIYENVEGAKTLPWIRPVGTKRSGPGLPAGPPPADEIARRVRKVLDEHLLDLRDRNGAGEVWWM